MNLSQSLPWLHKTMLILPEFLLVHGCLMTSKHRINRFEDLGFQSLVTWKVSVKQDAIKHNKIGCIYKCNR